MSLEEITLGAFAGCNSLRIFVYSHRCSRRPATRTALPPLVHDVEPVPSREPVHGGLCPRQSVRLVAGSLLPLNAACCIAIVAIVYGKRRRYLRRSQSLRTRRGRPGSKATIRNRRAHRLPPLPSFIGTTQKETAACRALAAYLWP